MAYFNFKRQYNIWLSPNENQFLPMRNQLRLMHSVKANPGIEKRLVYSSSCLKEAALADLHSFCNKYKIIPVEFESIVPLLTGDDLELARIAILEIDNFKQGKGGNLAGASDCIRLIESIIEIGCVYSDFDVQTTLLQLFPNPEQSCIVQLQGPVLFSGVQMEMANNTSLLMSNNDFLAFSMEVSKQESYQLSQEAQMCLSNLQKVIINNYSVPFTKSRFLQMIEGLLPQLNQVSEPSIVLANCLALFDDDTVARTVFDVRHHLLQLWEHATEKGTKEFIHSCLKFTVMRLTGPEIYQNFFAHHAPVSNVPLTIPKTPNWSKYRTYYLESSVGYYDPICDRIKSKNSFHTVLNDLKSGRHAGGDLSWMPDGKDRMLSDEQKLNNTAGIMGRFWRQRPLRRMACGAARIVQLSPLSEAINEKRYALACRRAVVGGELDALNFLLDCKQKGYIQFDINEPSSNGKTALDWVITTRSIPERVKNAMIKALLQLGAEEQVNSNRSLAGATL